MIRVGSIVIRVDGPKRQLIISSATLDYVPRDDPDADFVMLRPRVGNGPNLSLDMHASQAPIPPRRHEFISTFTRSSKLRRLRGCWRLVRLRSTGISGHWMLTTSSSRIPKATGPASSTRLKTVKNVEGASHEVPH